MDIARFEVGGSIAVLVNTTPAAFWTLFSIYSHPKILENCRKEVSTIITTTTASSGKLLRSLDITRVKSDCPFLTSIFAEVLRQRTLGYSVRKVM